jgi:hypothetical protein
MTTGVVPSSASPQMMVQPGGLRQEAGPLPQKRGEIGFIEGVHHQPELQVPPIAITLPSRHPADSGVDLEAQIASASTVPITPASVATRNRNSTASVRSSQPDAAKENKCSHTVAGLQLTTLSLCAFQLSIVSACIGLWIVAIRSLSKNTTTAPTLIVSLHVIFVIVLIAQLIFLERTVFKLRVQRYAYLFPGENIPMQARAGVPTPVIAFAPWNRPPLPTYAAALAQSGAGTGDVEDHLIAAPPPPAYGITRGSRLILAGHMRQSILAQRPPSGLSYVNEVPEGEPGPENYEGLSDGPTDGQMTAGDQTEMERQRNQALAQLVAQLERPPEQPT